MQHKVLSDSCPEKLLTTSSFVRFLAVISVHQQPLGNHCLLVCHWSKLSDICVMNPRVESFIADHVMRVHKTTRTCMIRFWWKMDIVTLLKEEWWFLPYGWPIFYRFFLCGLIVRFRGSTSPVMFLLFSGKFNECFCSFCTHKLMATCYSFKWKCKHFASWNNDMHKNEHWTWI